MNTKLIFLSAILICGCATKTETAAEWQARQPGAAPIERPTFLELLNHGSEEAFFKSKKPGAKIGMTADEVKNGTSWGTPKRVNRTVTSRGTREQWVYDKGNYLYFENEVLTSVQN